MAPIDPHVMHPGDVAKYLGLSTNRVRQLDAELEPVRVIATRRRLYDPAKVAAYAAKRARECQGQVA